MKVTITTPFARLQVDLTAERAANLMEQALFASVPDADRQDAEDLVQGSVITLPDLDKKEKPPVAEVEVPAAKGAQKEAPPNRTNSPQQPKASPLRSRPLRRDTGATCTSNATNATRKEVST